jgi:hypothetical protein
VIAALMIVSVLALAVSLYRGAYPSAVFCLVVVGLLAVATW